MDEYALLYSIALIFSSAAVLATLAMFARQSLLVVYILVGIALGALGPNWVSSTSVIHEIANFGIVFLLFLLGLSMHPQKLLNSLKSALVLTCVSSLVFFVAAAGVARAFGMSWIDCVVIGVAIMFSSTIIGLKLLPSSDLYRQRTGEIIISVLLLQDLIAIMVLLVLQSRGVDAYDLGLLLLSLPGLIVVAFIAERYVLDPLIHRFDAIQEYIFLLALGWCLGFSVLAEVVGLSAEVGAFIAGVSLAASASTRFIARRLSPLRDFFLILFFFAVGAGLDLENLADTWAPALAIAGFILLIKPWLFQRLLIRGGDDAEISRDVGLRLGQASEFSLLVGFLAVEHAVISEGAGAIIHLATVATFIGSSYIVNRYLITPSNPVRAGESSD